MTACQVYARIFLCSLLVPCSAFLRDVDKFCQVFSLVTVKVLAWATAMFDQTTLQQTIIESKQESWVIFDHPTKRNDADESPLTQRKQSTADFALNFRMLTVEIRWNEPALKAIFCQGFHEIL